MPGIHPLCLPSFSSSASRVSQYLPPRSGIAVPSLLQLGCMQVSTSTQRGGSPCSQHGGSGPMPRGELAGKSLLQLWVLPEEPEG